eukprot:TRINITY_DN73066_c0_g1_i1.p2 TRINITY_DN73066_c0_g1~~TRINITY_DN73066_c0_g1_i1.p2  ORF type:complete len:286 (-),score=88.48 TRINITY_DN73066_c0_g1_i1:72-842(-)
MFMSSQPVMATEGVAATPEKKQRQEEKQLCFPVTTRTVLAAVAKHADKQGDVQVLGAESGMLILSGVVENLKKETTGVEFTLNDGTGRVRVRQYAATEGLEKEDAAICDGKYCMVAGNLRTTPATHITAVSLRAVRAADEVSYHLIEAAHAAMSFQRGGPPPRADMTAVASPMRAAVAGTVSAAGAGAGGPTSSEVLTFLEAEAEGKVEGVAFSAVSAKFPSASADALRAVLQQLIDAGEVYTTLDEDHFSPISAA